MSVCFFNTYSRFWKEYLEYSFEIYQIFEYQKITIHILSLTWDEVRCDALEIIYVICDF